MENQLHCRVPVIAHPTSGVISSLIVNTIILSLWHMVHSYILDSIIASKDCLIRAAELSDRRGVVTSVAGGFIRRRSSSSDVVANRRRPQPDGFFRRLSDIRQQYCLAPTSCESM